MKLNILGASCSGVTTLGQALAEVLNIPYFDSDDYFWEPTNPPFTTRRESGERNQKILGDLDKTPDWILGGSVIHWDEHLFSAFDLVIFLWVPPDTRMSRLEKREHQRYGDVIYTDPERSNQFAKFRDWAADYDLNRGLANRTLQAHEEWLGKLDCQVLEIRGDFSTGERVQLVTDKLKYWSLV